MCWFISHLILFNHEWFEVLIQSGNPTPEKYHRLSLSDKNHSFLEFLEERMGVKTGKQISLHCVELYVIFCQFTSGDERRTERKTVSFFFKLARLLLVIRNIASQW